jgi:hypothetical protein
LRITPPVAEVICSKPASVQPSPKALPVSLIKVAEPLKVMVVLDEPMSTTCAE